MNEKEILLQELKDVREILKLRCYHEAVDFIDNNIERLREEIEAENKKDFL